MGDLVKYRLSYPYSQYDSLARKMKTFDEFKNMVYGWVDKNAKFKDYTNLLEQLNIHVKNISVSEFEHVKKISISQ